MKLRIVYPRWSKLARQTEFHLPPHGPVVFAAAVPQYVEIEFVDENVESFDHEAGDPDLVGISMMLTCQVRRGHEIADEYRRRGVRVIFGGIATMLHAEETMAHADSVFLGEAEGRFEQVIEDLGNGSLRKVYDHFRDVPDIGIVGTARRDILKRDLYNYGGLQMVDLLHASRGCRFDCSPCCVGFLGGKSFRPRPYDRVLAEMESIDNQRLFFVDNSLAQDTGWEMGLFEAIEPLGRKWVSHPIEYRDDVMEKAARAGAWYVYQAIYGPTRRMRERIDMLKRHGIGIEGTILLGLDDQTEDDVRRLVEFTIETGIDMAEFTVLTPFPGTRIRKAIEEEGRLLSSEWNEYTADRVVFRPRHMSPERLQELYDWAWDAFYASEPQRFKMYRLLKKAL